MKKKEIKFTLAKIILGLIILILILLFVRSCAKIGIYLELEEKKYYVYHSTTFPLPKAKAYDNKGKKLNIEITIYKEGKEQEGIDTNHIGDKYVVYYKTYKRNMYLKKHIEVEIIRNPNLLGYTLNGISNIWTKEDVILTFVPNENNIEKYCVKGECSTNKEFTIEKNETFETYIIDENGNKSEKNTYEVTNIDKENPIIKEVNEYNNKGKRYIGVQGEDTLSGVAEYSYDGGKTYSTASTKEVTEGQIITIKIKDLVGNESEEYKYTVGSNKTEEDTKAPTFEITRTPGPNTRGWNKEDKVTLTIKAEDDISGVAGYSFDNGNTWQTEHIKEYTSTTTVKIKVKDNAGNISESKSVEVKIDKISPKIKAKKESETEYREIVTGTSYDEKIEIEIEEENIHEITFTKDGNVIPLEETISENGLYYIKVEDKAGNIKEVTFTVEITPGIYINGVNDYNYGNDNIVLTVEGEPVEEKTIFKKDNEISTYEIGSEIIEEGEYYLYVENEYGKNDEVTFYIDKTSPEVLSELTDDNEDDVLLTARDYSLNTVVIFENGTPTKCFAPEAGNEDGIECSESNFYNMEIYKMLEYNFDQNIEKEYIVVAKDKAGNETEYNLDSDIIPIYTIADLESVGSNRLVELSNGKEYFMSSAGSYRLMNNIDYNNTKYNQITAGTIEDNESPEHYTLRWTETKNTIITEDAEEIEGYKPNNFYIAENIVSGDELEDPQNYIEVTLNGETYRSTFTDNSQDLYFQGIEFNYLKNNDTEEYEELENTVKIICGDALDGYICDIEEDNSINIPDLNIPMMFWPGSYYSKTESNNIIYYDLSAIFESTMYLGINTSTDSFVGFFVPTDDGYEDVTSEMDSVMLYVFGSAKIYEINVEDNTYLFISNFLTSSTRIVTTNINKEIMIDDFTLDENNEYLYFSNDGINYRINNQRYYDYPLHVYTTKEAIDTISHITVDKDDMYYCTSNCSNDENWNSLMSSGDIELFWYTKQKWFVEINDGQRWSTIYCGYGYGDGDIKSNGFYFDKYGKYLIVKYKNNLYKMDYEKNKIYKYNKSNKTFEKITGIEIDISYRTYSRNPLLSIKFDGNSRKGYKITGLTNSAIGGISDNNSTGLFNNLEFSTIKNLTIDGAKLYGTDSKTLSDGYTNGIQYNSIGLLAQITKYSDIYDVTVNNFGIYPSKASGDYVGGLIGTSVGSVITNNTITGTAYNNEGWILANESWTYLESVDYTFGSNHVDLQKVTVPTGAISKYEKGNTIKLTQSGEAKYFYVWLVEDDILSLLSLDNSLTNEEITDIYYSNFNDTEGLPSDWDDFIWRFYIQIVKPTPLSVITHNSNGSDITYNNITLNNYTTTLSVIANKIEPKYYETEDSVIYGVNLSNNNIKINNNTTGSLYGLADTVSADTEEYYINVENNSIDITTKFPSSNITLGINSGTGIKKLNNNIASFSYTMYNENPKEFWDKLYNIEVFCYTRELVVEGNDEHVEYHYTPSTNCKYTEQESETFISTINSSNILNQDEFEDFNINGLVNILELSNNIEIENNTIQKFDLPIWPNGGFNPLITKIVSNNNYKAKVSDNIINATIADYSGFENTVYVGSNKNISSLFIGSMVNSVNNSTNAEIILEDNTINAILDFGSGIFPSYFGTISYKLNTPNSIIRNNIINLETNYNDKGVIGTLDYANEESSNNSAGFIVGHNYGTIEGVMLNINKAKAGEELYLVSNISLERLMLTYGNRKVFYGEVIGNPYNFDILNNDYTLVLNAYKSYLNNLELSSLITISNSGTIGTNTINANGNNIGIIDRCTSTDYRTCMFKYIDPNITSEEIQNVTINSTSLYNYFISKNSNLSEDFLKNFLYSADQNTLNNNLFRFIAGEKINFE